MILSECYIEQNIDEKLIININIIEIKIKTWI